LPFLGVGIMGFSDRLISYLQPLNLPETELGKLADSVIAAMELRAKELRDAIEAAQCEQEVYERKYRMDFGEFRAGYNPEQSFQEDYINWGFWQRVKMNRVSLLAQYEGLLQDMPEC